MSQPEFTLDAAVPGLVARDSSRAGPVQGGGLILTETVRVGSGATLTIVGSSCLSYVVEYRLTLDSAPGSPGGALARLTDVLVRIHDYNRAPVPLGTILTLLEARAESLLQGESLAISENPFGETVRIQYDRGAPTMVSLVYVVGL